MLIVAFLYGLFIEKTNNFFFNMQKLVKNENIYATLVLDIIYDNVIQDMKFGGTPLHWSSSREVIDSLIANNCDINALNFDKRTALHIMVILNIIYYNLSFRHYVSVIISIKHICFT